MTERINESFIRAYALNLAADCGIDYDTNLRRLTDLAISLQQDAAVRPNHGIKGTEWRGSIKQGVYADRWDDLHAIDRLNAQKPGIDLFLDRLLSYTTDVYGLAKVTALPSFTKTAHGQTCCMLHIELREAD